uniref:Tyrosine-protein kinase ephrin type A/B receptor-like domain-containing protein n=1 Tax=Percolomonas cosmopolitus TaxID=63605 RepID=A0A7S1KS87_9EUKA|mmetsp:Transcript_6250/g.23512  ORF Transcript_6250/g.23512 Transcript_6250/m.23512 type:complete len:804 (+) Transcript_6250:859-3270(+)|eukprot:CAMPEP_0117436114 /NCGR_PEP_ID=MMETSP0759-20121206/840_1 /TAXON_ID=63605 /ORGANISM="Percolomonas cosmopolitus, Strain WS" /LENGTH=803 /DNA_ID=CAMNT_0005227703 /DNA_START=760 /DNA_END=3171 /DNA_ORIENTATION=+
MAPHAEDHQTLKVQLLVSSHERIMVDDSMTQRIPALLSTSRSQKWSGCDFALRSVRVIASTRESSFFTQQQQQQHMSVSPFSSLQVITLLLSLLLCIFSGGHASPATSTAFWGAGKGSFGTFGKWLFDDATIPQHMTHIKALESKNVVQVAGASQMTALLLSDHTCLMMGMNSYGAIGDGTTSTKYDPFTLSIPNKQIKLVDIGGSFTLWVTTDNQVYGSGYNFHGELGDNSTVNRLTPVETKMTDGLAGKEIVQVVASSSHSMVRTADGLSYVWGSNSYGRLVIGTSSVSTQLTPVQIAMTGLLENKTISHISSRYQHSVFVCSDGTAFAGGYGYNGQLGNGKRTSYNYAPVAVNMTAFGGRKIVQAAAGSFHTTFLTQEGILYSTGQNSLGQLGISADLSLYVFSPLPVSNSTIAGKKFVSVSTDGSHVVIVSSESEVFGWGLNANGQLGVGSESNQPFPVKSGISSVSAAVPGFYHTVFIRSLCPSGEGPAFSASNIAECAPCANGTSSLLVDGASMCGSCPEGTWASGSSCELCPAGTFSQERGASSSATCQNCPVGHFSVAGASQCLKCDAGTYADTAGTATCKKCRGGTHSSAIGASSDSVCQDCPPGEYSYEGSVNCLGCLRGSYAPNSGTETCSKCPKGTASSEYAATNSSVCHECSAGYYTSYDGASSCMSCNPGTYAENVGASVCTRCASGTWSSAEAATSASTCQACGAGTYRSTSGGTSEASCLTCSSGTVSGQGASRCTGCAPQCANSNHTICVSCDDPGASKESAAAVPLVCWWHLVLACILGGVLSML